MQSYLQLRKTTSFLLFADPSRRGDIEILGFFLLHLLAGKLPWEDHLSNCNAVRDSKKQHLKNPDAFVKSMCGASVPGKISFSPVTIIKLSYGFICFWLVF